jgi:hypothetical protein
MNCFLFYTNENTEEMSAGDVLSALELLAERIHSDDMASFAKPREDPPMTTGINCSPLFIVHSRVSFIKLKSIGLNHLEVRGGGHHGSCM